MFIGNSIKQFWDVSKDKREDVIRFVLLLTYLKIKEKANDQTSHVLEKPPPYPLFVHPPSISLTARANLLVNFDLNRAIIAVNRTNAALQAIVTVDRLCWNGITMFSIFEVVRLIAWAGNAAASGAFLLANLIFGAYITKKFVRDFKTARPG